MAKVFGKVDTFWTYQLPGLSLAFCRRTAFAIIDSESWVLFLELRRVLEVGVEAVTTEDAESDLESLEGDLEGDI
jgi:hypothetical protein